MTRVRTEAVHVYRVGDEQRVVIRHDERASYARSVIPCAVRHFRTLGCTVSVGYTMAPTTEYGEDACFTDVIFRPL